MAKSFNNKTNTASIDLDYIKFAWIELWDIEVELGNKEVLLSTFLYWQIGAVKYFNLYLKEKNVIQYKLKLKQQCLLFLFIQPQQ